MSTAAKTVDGITFERYLEVEGETFQATANGPSFFNDLGKFKLRRVNGSEQLSGAIRPDGGLTLTAFRGSLTGYLPLALPLAVAFGEMCADEGFREVVEAVRRHDG